MDTLDTLDRLQTIFREVFDRQDLSLSEAMTPNDIEGWDSLAQVRLIFAIQEEFGLSFDTDVLARLGSVRGIVQEIHGGQ